MMLKEKDIILYTHPGAAAVAVFKSRLTTQVLLCPLDGFQFLCFKHQPLVQKVPTT